MSEWINFEWKNSKCVTESPTWRLKWNVFIQFQPQEEHNFIKNWYSFKFTAWRPIKWKGECDRFNYVLIGNEDPSWTFYLLLLNFQKHEFLSFTKYFGCLFSSWPKKKCWEKVISCWLCIAQFIKCLKRANCLVDFQCFSLGEMLEWMNMPTKSHVMRPSEKKRNKHPTKHLSSQINWKESESQWMVKLPI